MCNYPGGFQRAIILLNDYDGFADIMTIRASAAEADLSTSREENGGPAQKREEAGRKETCSGWGRRGRPLVDRELEQQLEQALLAGLLVLSGGAHAHSAIPISDRRSALYEKMARDLDEKGPMFLKHGQTSQSLSLSDLFTVKDGSVAPVLKAADPPVRANVLYLSSHYSLRISEALKPILDPYFDKLIWFQNSNLYHFRFATLSIVLRLKLKQLLLELL
ncbi:hypothetical protein ACLB2K_053749 [Fragaria x ananassa]